jgi:predicted DNA-binding transcriptional regulator AlpA
MNRKASGIIDQWLTIGELAKLFGLSEESIKRLAKKNGFPLRRLTPYATPGVLESELFRWLKAQPPVGRAVRASRVSRSRNISVPKHRR